MEENAIEHLTSCDSDEQWYMNAKREFYFPILLALTLKVQ
jgi:hypothetical protein